VSESLIPSIEDPDIEYCKRCDSGCKFDESDSSYCITHNITWDGVIGHHYCLEHQCYHCYEHYRICRKKFGTSVMVGHPETKYQLKKRAEQIIEEQEEEIKKLEAWVVQLKTGRFICAECRQVCCVCNISNFKYY
jgi:hypothetical protein